MLRKCGAIYFVELPTTLHEVARNHFEKLLGWPLGSQVSVEMMPHIKPNASFVRTGRDGGLPPLGFVSTEYHTLKVEVGVTCG
jgi:hypothetical protein